MGRPGEFGIALKRERVRRGWSQAEVGRRAGVTSSYISKLESGSLQSPSDVNARRIATAFDMTPDELLGLSRPSETPPRTLIRGQFVMVPIVDVRLAAGITTYGDTGDVVYVRAERAIGKDLVASRVIGGCMEPEILDGDIAVVDISNRNPREGQLVAVLTEDGNMMVKRYALRDGQPILRDNKGRIYRPNGAKIQGVVIQTSREYR